MKSTQQGFTLIELVMVIVILGILAATAIPRFVDLSSEATIAAAQGVAGGMASASAVNYATRAARGAGNAINTTNAGPGTGGCANDTVGLLLNDGMPAGYGVAYNGATVYGSATAFGQTWTCNITDGAGNNILDGNNNPITFTLHYVD